MNKATARSASSFIHSIYDLPCSQLWDPHHSFVACCTVLTEKTPRVANWASPAIASGKRCRHLIWSAHLQGITTNCTEAVPPFTHRTILLFSCKLTSFHEWWLCTTQPTEHSAAVARSCVVVTHYIHLYSGYLSCKRCCNHNKCSTSSFQLNSCGTPSQGALHSKGCYHGLRQFHGTSHQSLTSHGSSSLHPWTPYCAQQ